LNLFVAGMVLLGAAAVAGYGYYLYASSPVLTWERGWGWRLALVASAWLISAVVVWHFIYHLPEGELDFDGENWYFLGHVGTAYVRFDGQSCLLLRFEDDLSKGYWLWLEERNSSQKEPHRWLDLRRAVYSRAVAPKTSTNLI
jgi:hypothetical protein